MSPWLTLSLLALAAYVVGWAVVRCLARRAKREFASGEERVARTRALPASAAEATARSLLESGTAFAVSVANTEFRSGDQLPAGVRKLFERYRRIEMTAWPYAVLDRDMVRPSSIDRAYICIGSIAPQSDMEGEISVRPDDETVYEIHFGEPPDAALGVFPTVYHWLVAVNEERTS